MMKFRLFSCLSAIIFITMFISCFAQAIPSDILLSGRLTLSIPESGYTEYAYSAYYSDALGEHISGDDITFDVSMLPDGVVFNVNTGIATVYDYAEPGESFELTLSSSLYKLSDKKFIVNISDNLIINGDFRDMPEKIGWNVKNSSPFLLNEGELSFNFIQNSKAGYMLTLDSPISLSSSALYEFSCEIKSESKYIDEKQMSFSSETPGESAAVYIFDPNVSDWTTVSVPVRCDHDGSFIFSLIITPTSDSVPISLKNISLKKANNLPTSIHLSAPQSFNIPKTNSLVTAFEARVLDQEGAQYPAKIIYSVSPETEAITVFDGKIAITSEALPGTYIVTAVLDKYPDVSSEFTMNVIETGIDNGNFESDKSYESWIPSSDGEYTIISNKDNSYASFTPNSEMGVLYNNAYVSFSAGQSYVFRADLRQKYSDAPCYITFITEDSENPDNLVLCAYFELTSQWDTYKAVFTPEADLSGRFIIAINVSGGFDEQTVFIDNIEVVPAVIAAEHVKIKGTAALGNTLLGMFDFVNNFDGESASITNWALASDPKGPYKTLSYSNMSEIEVTENMSGLYIRFEVTPISVTAGIVGETAYSTPVKVPASPSHISITDNITPPKTPEVAPKPPVLQKLSPLNLSSFSGSYNQYSDTEGHWAMQTISDMTAAGVITGYQNGIFMPNEKITRAEFCAFVMRAFGLSEGKYNGSFIDVSPQSWYAGVIQSMHDFRLVSGVTENTFAPNESITREQIVTILLRAASQLRKLDSITSSPPFSDENAISEYAEPYVLKAYALGIANGDNAKSFNPLSPATRAEAIVFISRTLDALLAD